MLLALVMFAIPIAVFWLGVVGATLFMQRNDGQKVG